MSQRNQISIKNLSVGYKGNRVLSDVCAEVLEPGLILLCGKNGSGKSTLLRSILGLLKPLSGDIYINGKQPTEMSAAQKATLLSYVAAKPLQVSNMSIRDVTETGRAPYTSWANTFSHHDTHMVEQALEYLQIKDIQHKNIEEVSDGERQKTMIARALAQDTPFLLLDEPTAFLDYPSKNDLIRILIRLSQEFSKTVILTSHDLDLLIPAVGEIWFCNSGELVSGTSETINKIAEFKLFYNKT